MDTLLFSAFTIAYIVLFVMSIRILRKRHALSIAFLLPVIAGLIYDNGIIASGKYIGEGRLLKELSLVRYYMHAFFTPLLVLFAWKSLEQGGIRPARTTAFRSCAFLLTIGLITVELLTEVVGLKVTPEWSYGVLSYGNADPSSGPPIMVLIVAIVLLAASIAIWKVQGWIWFFFGSLIMTIGSAVSIPVDSGAVTNLFELALLASLVGTAAYQASYTKQHIEPAA
ncbi:hypothetical protein FZC83_19355 [Rossellomorea marisflavi]|uniref:Phospholipid phosphatase n=1 Tax=Rossellomorea marisflavi TaxID=189381 RepID=A0A5D4RL95_9BACI|nr:hypothetical protein [Rossellomorea marisflavi]MDW4525049.1 hypothetical protein [Rossellomorea marisflavi]TYS50576.1 hypothetical protein FZC83_19355 [Rossellomorea marisflavi]